MARSDTTLVAIGGGGTNDAILERIFSLIAEVTDARVAVMTVASNETEGMTSAYNSMFRKNNVGHVSMIDISTREDAFNSASIKKIEQADLIYFTGGDQLNVTSLFGGSPLHNVLHDRMKDGVVVAGTSAGAAMMSTAMIQSGDGDFAPRVGGVEIAPGLGLVPDTIIDTHFSQRGRHGRLMTAVAHHPQYVGIGLDERTAIVVEGEKFTVVGEGAATVFCGSRMTHSDLVFRKDGEPISMFDLRTHVLTNSCWYNIDEREPYAPKTRSAPAR
jgi:cyanophycinase